MMSSDNDPTGADDPKQAVNRPEPAKPPVLEVRDADPVDPAATEVEPGPMIESTTVGNGHGLPPAERKSDDMGPQAEAQPGDIAAASGAERFDDDAAGATGNRPDTAEDASAAAKAAVTSGMPRVDRATGSTSSAGATPAPDRTEPDRTGPDRAVPDLTAPAVPATAPPRRRGGIGSMMLGGAIAAGLGAGAAWLVIPQLPPAWQPVAPATPVDTAALTSQLQAQSQEAIDAAAARLRDEAVAAAAESARAEIAAQAQTLETRSAEAAAASGRAAAEAAMRSAAASTAAPQLSEEAVRSLTDQAAAAGADAARKIIAESPASDTPADLNATLSAQAAQLTALDEAIGQLRDAVPQDLAARLDQIPGDLQARLDQIPVLAQRLDQIPDDLQARLDELSGRPTLDQAQIDSLQQIAGSVWETRTALTEAREQAEQELARVRDQATELQAAADEATRRARTAAAAATLAMSLTGAGSGDRPPAVTQLQEAGVEVSPALTAEVVPLDQLRAEYDQAAQAGLRAALRSGEGSNGSVIGNFLRAQTGARSVTPREGSDADAVLSRAGDAVARGNIGAALTEIGQLPAPSRQAMADWIAKAEAWTQARGAVVELTAQVDGGAATPSAPAPPAPAPTTPAPSAPAPSAETPADPAQPSN